LEPLRFWVDNAQSLRKAADAVARLRVDPGHPLEVIARPPRRQKSHDQRKLFHALLTDIGLEIGLTLGEMKQLYKEWYYGVDRKRVRYRGRDK
jgi:hypothetical protein